MDSTTLLYYLLKKKFSVEAISFNYGQKHQKELRSARNICEALKIPFNIINMQFLGNSLNSSLTQAGKKIPNGHYASKNMKSTVVPNRNLIMTSIANAIGLSRGIKKIALAVHAGDHAVYPDCRPIFIDSLEETLIVSSGENVRVLTPFIEMSKSDILKIGLKLDVPYKKTWSCYNGRKKACGKCGTCIERLEAFKDNNAIDLLKYE